MRHECNFFTVGKKEPSQGQRRQKDRRKAEDEADRDRSKERDEHPDLWGKEGEEW